MQYRLGPDGRLARMARRPAKGLAKALWAGFVGGNTLCIEFQSDL